MRQGSMREDIALKYNEHGNICESSRTAGGFPHETGTISSHFYGTAPTNTTMGIY